MEDVKTFVSKLDVLIEFWQRLQILNSDSSISDHGTNCLKCVLRKRCSEEKIKHKEISCQTEENHDERSIVSSSNETELMNLEEPESVAQNTNTANDIQLRTKLATISQVVGEVNTVSHEKERSKNLGHKLAHYRQLIPAEIELSSSVETQRNSDSSLHMNAEEVISNPTNDAIILQNSPETLSDVLSPDMVQIHSNGIKSETIEETFNANEESNVENNSVQQESSDTAAESIEIEEPSPFLEPLERTPCPSPIYEFGFGEEENTVQTSTEIKDELDNLSASIDITTTFTASEDLVENYAEDQSGREVPDPNPKDNGGAILRAIRKINPLVRIDRRLADRVLHLGNQGIQVQYSHRGHINDLIEPKSKKKNTSKISLYDDEENLERCRQYLLERLKSSKKGKKGRKSFLRNRVKRMKRNQSPPNKR